MASIGQLAATTPANIIPAGAGGGAPRTLSLFFYNAHATDDQEVQVTLTRSGGTEYHLAKATIKKKEQFVISNLSVEDFDAIGAAATAATSVNYVVLPGTKGGMFDVYSTDSTGARKGSTTAGSQVYSGNVSLLDNVKLMLGTGDDITMAWDGTDLDVLQAAENSSIKWGIDGAGIDQVWYCDTASTNMTLDQSADSLIFNGAMRIVFTGTTGQPEIHLVDNLADALSIEISGSTDLLTFTTTNDAECVSPIGLRTRSATAVAITGATTLKLSDSGGIFTVSQAAAYDIDLPSPTTGPGCSYFFSVTAPGANAVTLTVAGSAATFVGSLITEGQIIVATGSTLTIASGVAVLGDSIEVRSIATNLYHVKAVSSILNGFTIA